MCGPSGKLTLAAFGWASAGWVIPAADLPCLDAAVCRQTVRDNWTRSTVSDIQALAKLGEVFYYFTAIKGELSGPARSGTRSDSWNESISSGDRRRRPGHCSEELSL